MARAARQSARGLGFSNGPFPNVSEAVAAFEAKTGIPLACEPGEVPENEVRGPVQEEHLSRALPVIEGALMRYPVEIRGQVLKKMTLFGHFLMRGKPFFGCAFPKVGGIVLAVRAKTPAGRLRRTLHHEIAHLIELHPSFDVDSWLESTQGEPYLGQGHRTAFNEKSVPDMMKKGFITRYAAKNRHEDFADLADHLWMTPKRTLAACQRFPRLGVKSKLITAAYRKFAPDMALPWEA